MPNYACHVGNTFKLRLQVYTAEDRRTPFDLTDAEVEFFGADRAVSPRVTVQKSIGAGILVAAPRSGGVEVTLGPTDTELFGDDGGVLLFYVRLTSGPDVYTLVSDRLVIQKLPF